VKHLIRTGRISNLALLLILLPGLSLHGQTKLKPGFNIFSPAEDVEIGKQSALEVEKQMPVLSDRALQAYLTKVGQRLAAVTPGEKFPYQFKLVNVSDINAFALPGGFMYVNRGLVEVSRNEGELAGVMAHEIAHVALRHGTNQASKASLAQAGLAALGGKGGSTAQVIQAVGGFGMNSLFLKFSRSAEQQADLLGTQILAQAGYNPLDMVGMFETLRKESGRDPSSLEKFFSSHPAPADRAVRIKKEISMLGSPKMGPPVGNFAQIKSLLQQMPKAKSLTQLQEQAPKSGGQGQGSSLPASSSIELPSPSIRAYQSRDSLFRIDMPDNWQAKEEPQGVGVTLVPRGGAIETREGGQIICGIIVSLFEQAIAGSAQSSGPFRGKDQLEQTTNKLVNQLLQTNSYLQLDSSSLGRNQLDGASALYLSLVGQSPANGKKEKVLLHAREVSGDRLLYVLSISQEGQPTEVIDTQGRILRSLKVRK
jgi:hypothetical protein